MAFKFLLGVQENLPESKFLGHLYGCTDTGNMFFDFVNSLGEMARVALNADKASRLRYKDTNNEEQELLPQDIATKTDVAAKVATAQGVAQYGKLLAINSSGDVVPTDVSAVGGALTWGALAGHRDPVAEEDGDEEES